jgi:hypothetical protein
MIWGNLDIWQSRATMQAMQRQQQIAEAHQRLANLAAHYERKGMKLIGILDGPNGLCVTVQRPTTIPKVSR